jgi:hypothetical protein
VKRHVARHPTRIGWFIVRCQADILQHQRRKDESFEAGLAKQIGMFLFLLSMLLVKRCILEIPISGILILGFDVDVTCGRWIH